MNSQFDSLIDDYNNEIRKNKKLIEYAKLLSDEISDMSGLCFIHGWKSKRVEQGEKLRSEIKELFGKTWEELKNEK